MTNVAEKDKTAKTLFLAFFGLALGWAGVLVAAAAVAVESTWSNGATEQRQARERRGGWLDNQRSWLDADHTQRTARTKQRKAWLDKGGDPKARPEGPSVWQQVRDGIRRRVANTVVAGADFAGGFREGWKTADKTRRDGGTFRDVANTRPNEVVCSNCRRARVPVGEGGVCADCAQPTPGSNPEPTPAPTHEQVPATTEGGDTTPSKAAPPVIAATKQQAQEMQDVAPVCPACGGRTLLVAANGPSTPTYRCSACQLDFEPPKDFFATCTSCGLSENYATREEAAFMSARHQDAKHAAGKGSAWKCNRCGGNAGGYADVEAAQRAFIQHKCPANGNQAWPTAGDTFSAQCNACGHTVPKTHASPRLALDALAAHTCTPASTSTEGDTMTAPTQTSNAPATESNATVLRSKLQGTKTTLTRIAELTDELAAERTKLDGQVRDSEEFATATGQSSQARQALDESKALSSAMGDRLGEFSQGAVSAEDQMAHAADGLRPAENAEDELRAAGADHRAVAPAGANA
jgi:hypothetical protein